MVLMVGWKTYTEEFYVLEPPNRMVKILLEDRVQNLKISCCFFPLNIKLWFCPDLVRTYRLKGDLLTQSNEAIRVGEQLSNIFLT